MEKPVKLACRSVWKLYGPNAADFPDVKNVMTQKSHSERHLELTGEQIRAAGLIGAVRAANVEIREGEIFVIMGLSGSGKSTLVRCLSRLIEPTAGEVLFEGRDLLSMPERELIEVRRRKMGMVFQQFALLPHLTVLQNVAFPLEVQGAAKAEREARAREVIELVGLKGRESYFPRELSGGQQQRVGIARSLAVEPDLWFLDEPFSALDPLIRREMQDEFLRLQSMLHKTIVFITHDFDEAIRLADRIAIMQDGEIIQTATPEELVLNPATDYVAEFTRHIPRAKILTARSVMTPSVMTPSMMAGGPAPEIHAGDVQADDRIEAIAERIEAADSPFRVLEEGEVIGSIDRQAVIDVLVGRDPVRRDPVRRDPVGREGAG
ncbi:quaternary amine ABC transporter ATP-binding protein [Denitrobaculum tricleocarpae]|uniref:Quaternary amine transport ATP-binding protein n=1 Tax=Denitrobaculum tricleocarpae TaxID=2591009 RepID=A0A545STP5_9PROT|nr:betaine/proline/choline family ABC transporter ATP-binding protein [Denitrobaculum tricleocarpae]TQV68335.1 betaine/proline/choline family ABC transporter ATP-binding protein [Denitrobaculum tricleocarpae]